MKRIRSVVTGEVISIEDEGAAILIEAKIYEAVDDESDDDMVEPDEREHRPRPKDRYRRRDLRSEE